MGYYEKILKTLVGNLNVGIHIVDNNGKTIYYNDIMGEIEGLNKEKVLGKKISEYLNSISNENSTIMKSLETKKKFKDVIQRYGIENGRKITTINSTIPVMEKGKTIAAIEISDDLTQFKEANEKLCKLQSAIHSTENSCSFKSIIGVSKSIYKSISKAKKASLSNSPVLIYGETGCGKEIFAKSIHYNGIRGDKPFVPINCAAIPSTLLEGMLFGVTKGSFTGAENRKGLFRLANKGTILLDEINSMEPYLQSKLLRVLQDGYIRPVGSNRTLKIDVRIIATLNEKPEKLMAEGKLRKDFYYRLSVIRIDIEPLRKRKEDIIPLVEYYIKFYNKIMGKNVKNIHDNVIQDFMQYKWPGNVRELKNVIEFAMNMCEREEILGHEYFESKIVMNGIKPTFKYNSNNVGLEEYIGSIEKAIIKNELKKQNYNITRTANILKITRQSLQYKIKKYLIQK